MHGDNGGPEPQRALGFPVNRGQRRPQADPGQSQQYVAGIPRSWLRMNRTEPLDTRWVRHPVHWLQWRARVRRDGPYAPNYEELWPKDRAPRSR